MLETSPYLMSLAPHLHKSIVCAFEYKLVPASTVIVLEGKLAISMTPSA
jgi:hypothetical protein